MFSSYGCARERRTEKNNILFLIPITYQTDKIAILILAKYHTYPSKKASFVWNVCGDFL